jgi:hypothetical protein
MERLEKTDTLESYATVSETRLERRSLLAAASIALIMFIAPPVAALTTNGSGISPGSQPIAGHVPLVLQPTIRCLMWSPNDASGFSAADVTAMNQYLTGVQQYVSNQNTTAGLAVEPTVRQYGVWGAYFPTGCVVDHGNLPPAGTSIPWFNAGPTIQAEIAHAQAPQPSGPGLGSYGPETVILVFTKGMPFDGNYGTPTNGCSYHKYFGNYQNYNGSSQYYGLIPFPSNTWCSNSNALNEFQTLASHELFEAATDPMVSSAQASWYCNSNRNEICDGCPGAQLTFADGSTGYVSQAVDNFSGSCQSFVSEEKLGAAVVKTGTNTVNVISAAGQAGPSHLTGDGVNWNFPGVLPLGGVISDAPSAVSPDGTAIDVWARGLDGSLYNQHFDGTSWWGWWGIGGYINGPPAVGYRTSTGTEDIWVLAPDGTIIGAQVNPVTWTIANNNIALPNGVLAVTPPQVFTVNGDCYYVFVNGSDAGIYISKVCSGPTVPSFTYLAQGGGPRLVSSFENTPSIVDVTYGGMTPDLSNPFGGSTPGELIWNNGVQQGGWGTTQGFVGPWGTAAIGSTGGGVVVGRGLGLYTGALFASHSPTNSNFSAFTQITTGSYANAIASSPLVFSPDGQNTDVFYSLGATGLAGSLFHMRFNGTSWQTAQNLELYAQ